MGATDGVCGLVSFWCHHNNIRFTMERKSLFQHFVDCFRYNYFNFSGRARRREYWGFMLFWYIMFIVLILIGFSTSFDATVYSPRALYMHIPFIALLSLAFLVSIIPGIAVLVRRLHDVGFSGWWMLAPIAIRLLSILVLAPSILGFSIAPSTMVISSIIFNILQALVSIGLLILLVMDSQHGPNKYGEDPKAAERPAQ